MKIQPHDIYASHGFLIYGDIAAGGWVAKAFRITAPDLSGAADEYKEEIHERLCRLCSSLAPDERMQWQWRVTGDFSDVLRFYDAQTQTTTDSAADIRKRRSADYQKKYTKRLLRRSELVLYFAVRMTAKATGLFAGTKAVAASYEILLAQQQTNFVQVLNRIRTILGETIAVAPLDSYDAAVTFYRFLNPTLDALPSPAYAEAIDLAAALQDSAWNSDIHPFDGPNLYFDGHYHAVYALRRLGRHTFSGIINSLTDLPFLNYQLTLNIVARDAIHEQKVAESAIERLEAEQAQKFKRSRQVGIDKLDAQVERLAKEHLTPFDLTFCIRVWAKDQATLNAQSTAIRNAVHSMRGAEVYQNTLPASAADLFFASWPGNAFTPYTNRAIYIEEPALADIIPFSSTFLGIIDEPDAIYEGEHSQLVGVKIFFEQTPQPAVIFGDSRVGKSVFIQDLLDQTAAQVVYTVIVEEGASHTEYTKRMGGRTLIISPDCPYCINPFDTLHLPLSRTHVAFVVALLAHQSGRVESLKEQTARRALINYYVQKTYDGYFSQWSNRHPDLLARVRREALAVSKWHATENDPDRSLLDTWAFLRDALAAKDPAICTFVANISEDEIIRFAKDPQTANRVRDHAFTYFEPDEFPQLTPFTEYMDIHRDPEHDAATVSEIATNLRTWTADEGTYGGLFDGTTNTPLDGRVVHFELSKIPNDLAELKSAVALLIASVIRQHLYNLPRSQRKQIVLEEMARYIDIPDAAKLINELFAQMAKTNTWVCAVVQQYAQFSSSPVRPIIMGNAKQFFIMRQSDPANLDSIAEAVGLPPDMRNAVARYPIPADMPAHDRHSLICYHVKSRVPSITGTLINRLPQ